MAQGNHCYYSKKRCSQVCCRPQDSTPFTTSYARRNPKQGLVFITFQLHESSKTPLHGYPSIPFPPILIALPFSRCTTRSPVPPLPPVAPVPLRSPVSPPSPTQRHQRTPPHRFLHTLLSPANGPSRPPTSRRIVMTIRSFTAATVDSTAEPTAEVRSFAQREKTPNISLSCCCQHYCIGSKVKRWWWDLGVEKGVHPTGRGRLRNKATGRRGDGEEGREVLVNGKRGMART